MGNLLSKPRLLLAALAELLRTYRTLEARLARSPGLPVPSPTVSFWMVPPADVHGDARAYKPGDAAAGGGTDAGAKVGAEEELPEEADVVIVGSGITGTAVAHTILAHAPRTRVVMLEARDACSGATGRNGGHINPPLYHDYRELVEAHGAARAATLVRFRLAHMAELARVARDEGLAEHAEIRQTEHLEVHMTEESWEEAKAGVKAWKEGMPQEAATCEVWEGAEARERFCLPENVLGCVVVPGGAIHPYRFVTGLLTKLLQRHPDGIHLATHTPCTDIQPPSTSSPHYTLLTPRGAIRATHVVHATNGWASHLLPSFRRKLVAFRGTMTAQRPGSGLAPCTRAGARSFVFHPAARGYDYLTQRPGPGPGAELMLGGAWAQARDGGLPTIGDADDAVLSFESTAYLAGVLPAYFGARWGREGAPQEGEREEGWGEGRLKAAWSGVLGISADGMPWVGRLPEKLAGRKAPRGVGIGTGRKGAEEGGAGVAEPGEWIAAGYSGEGMVHAWMSGKALAHMVLGCEREIEAWFPEMLRVTEKRWKEADVEKMLARFML
ncbi:FAD dependent oxidoreductase [Obba rivulosa]|uniref:FAD dependent oxidoreductase n=1 Tax=Obba rivulosa TaxID=1052685 RepID=A0A8E2DQZ8_9APHY|nr:FAD dependent oxidoreductase [Obba rivulosa]